jgi:hypothetical protein
VRQVRQNAPRHVLLVVDDAGEATPRLLQSITDLGIQIQSSSEYRPTFDEVFARLIESDDYDPALEAARDRRADHRAA